MLSLGKIAAAVAALCFVAVAAVAQSPIPGTNTPLQGCVEGRAARIVNGWIGCAPAAAPTVTSCGTSPTLSPNATDFVGQVTTGTGLVTSCVIKLSKLYTSPGMGCIAQSNSTTAIVGGSPVVGTDGTVTTVTLALVLSLAGTKITYVCFPI